MNGRASASSWRSNGWHFGLWLALSVIAPARAAGAAAQDPAVGAQAQATPEQQGIPVGLDGEVVFYVKEGIGPFTAEERAQAAEKRIELIANDPFYSDDQLSITRQEQGFGFFYRGKLVGSLSDEDAAKLGSTAEELSTKTILRLKQVIGAYRERRLPEAWIRSGLYFALSTVVLVLALFGLRRANRRFHARLDGALKLAATVPDGGGLIRRIWRLGSFQKRALVMARVLVTVVLVLVYLQFAFSVVPLTRGFALSVIDYLIEPLRTIWSGLLANIGGLFFILVAVLLARYSIKGLRWLFSEAAAGRVSLPGVEPEWALATYKIVRLLVIATVGVMIFPYIPGSDSDAFRSIGLLGGAVFTLGASSTAGNFIGGLSLILAKTLHKGDHVKIGDVEGDVLEITLAVVRIRTIKNEVVTIPSGATLSAHVTNYSALARQSGLILHTSVTIGYDVPWRRVHELLIQAALATDGILREPPPFVLQVQLSDFYIEYQVNAYTSNANAMAHTYGELHQNIQDSFNQGGVEIMSPHYASLRDGNESTIPQADRKPGDEPRKFALRVDGDRA